MIHKMALTHARINLGAVVKKVHLKGESFILEKDGIPVAALVPIDQMKKQNAKSKKR